MTSLTNDGPSFLAGVVDTESLSIGDVTVPGGVQFWDVPNGLAMQLVQGRTVKDTLDAICEYGGDQWEPFTIMYSRDRSDSLVILDLERLAKMATIRWCNKGSVYEPWRYLISDPRIHVKEEALNRLLINNFIKKHEVRMQGVWERASKRVMSGGLDINTLKSNFCVTCRVYHKQLTDCMWYSYKRMSRQQRRLFERRMMKRKVNLMQGLMDYWPLSAFRKQEESKIWEDSKFGNGSGADTPKKSQPFTLFGITHNLDPEFKTKLFEFMDYIKSGTVGALEIGKTIFTELTSVSGRGQSIIDVFLLFLTTLSNLVYAPSNSYRLSLLVSLFLAAGFSVTGTLTSLLSLLAGILGRIWMRLKNLDLKLWDENGKAELFDDLADKLPLEMEEEEESELYPQQGKIHMQMLDEMVDMEKLTDDELADEFAWEMTKVVAQGMKNDSYIPKGSLSDSVKGAARGFIGVKNFVGAIEYFVKLGWTVTSFVYVHVTGKPLATPKSEVALKDALRWMEIAEEFNKVWKPDLPAKDPFTCNKMWTHYETTLPPIQREIVKHGYTGANFAPFFRYITLFKEKIDIIETYRLGSHTRVEPVWLALCGFPGMGKSTCMSMIVLDLFAEYVKLYGKLAEPDRGAPMYFRKVGIETQKYWNGYANQFACILDDWLQQKDPKELGEVYRELIALVNTAAYSLEMADVGSKGRYFFDSLLLVTTQNVDGKNLEQGVLKTPEAEIADMNALRRRRSLLVEFSLRNAYLEADGKPKHDVTITRDKIKVRFYDPMTEKRESETWMDYDELMVRLKAKLVLNHEKLSNKLDALTLAKAVPIAKAGGIVDEVTIKQEIPPEPEQRVPGFGAGNNRNVQRDVAVNYSNQRNYSPRYRRQQRMQGLYDIAFGDGVKTHGVYGKVFGDGVQTNVLGAHDGILYRVQVRDRYSTDEKYVQTPGFNGIALKEKLMKNGRPFYVVKNKETNQIINVHADYVIFEDEFAYGVEMQGEKKTPIKNFIMTALFRSAGYLVNGSLLTVELCSGYLIPILTFLMLVLGSLAAYKTVKWLFRGKDKDESVTPQGVPGVSREPSGDKRRSVVAARNYRRAWRRSQPKGPVRQQGSEEAWESILRSIDKNVVRINVNDTGIDNLGNIIGGMTMCGLFIGERVMITARHLLLACKFGPDDKNLSYINLTYNNGRPSQSVPLSECVVAPNAEDDFVVIRFPAKRVQNFKRITDHFIDSKDIYTTDISRICMYVHVPTKPIIMREADRCCLGNVEIYGGGPNGEMEQAVHSLNYNIPTGDGECGSPIICTNLNLRRKLLGIHTAGGSRGVGVLLHRELLEEAMEDVCGGIIDEVDEVHQQGAGNELVDEDAKDKTPMFDYGHNLFLGKLKKEHKHRLPHRNEIVKSPIHGFIQPPVTGPSQLVPVKIGGVEVKPMQNVMNNFAKAEADTRKVPDLYRDHLKTWIKTSVGYVAKGGVWNEEEGVQGKRNWRFSSHLHMDTSEGPCPPEPRPQGEKGKRYLFRALVQPDKKRGQDGIYTMKDPLRARVRERIKAYQEGRRYQGRSQANLKDERRPWAKIEAALTRGFYANEVANTIAGRMYFGTFLENLKLCREQNGVTVGINPHSRDWMWVGDPRIGSNTRTREGDFKTSDFLHFKDIDEIIREAINEWYQENDLQWNEYDDEVRNGLVSDALYTIDMVVCDDLVRLVGNYMLSGFFATAEWNSLHFALVIRMCFAEWLLDDERIAEFGFEISARMKDLVASGEFLKHVESRTNGDDFLFWVTKEFDGFTFIEFAKYGAKFGYKITPANKTGIPEPYKDLSTCTYLKRYFRWDNGEMFAPMTDEDLQEQTNWVSRKINPYIALQDNIHNIIREYFHHGRAVFDMKRAFYNGILTNYGLVPYTNTWEYLYGKYVGNPTREIELDSTPIRMQMLKSEVKNPYPVLDCSSMQHMFSKIYERVPRIEVEGKIDGTFEATLSFENLDYIGVGTNKALAKENALIEFFLHWKNIEAPYAWDHNDPGKKIFIGDHSALSFKESLRKYCERRKLKDKKKDDSVPGDIDYEIDAIVYWLEEMLKDRSDMIFISLKMLFEIVKKKPSNYQKYLVLVDLYRFMVHEVGTEDVKERFNKVVRSELRMQGKRSELTWGEIDDLTKIRGVLLNPPKDVEVFNQWYNEPRLIREGYYLRKPGKAPRPPNVDYRRRWKRTTFRKYGDMPTRIEAADARPDIALATQCSRESIEVETISQKIFKLTGKPELELVCIWNTKRGRFFQRPDFHTLETDATEDESDEKLQKLVHMQMMKEESDAPPVTEVVGLTTATEEVPPIEQEDRTEGTYTKAYSKLDPYQDQGLRTVLSRRLVLGSFVWDPTDQENVEVFSLNFPYVMFQASDIMLAKLTGFHGFRSGIRIRVQVNGTPYHFGSLMLAWLPYSEGTTNWKLGNIYTMSDCNALELDPSVQTVAEFTIPYLNRNIWLTDEKWTQNKGHIGTVMCRVMFPLATQNSTATPDVKVTVWAEFVDPEVAMMTIHIPSFLTRMKRNAIKMQMKREQKSRSTKGLLTEGFNALTGVGHFAKQLPLVGSIGGIAEKVGTVGAAFSTMFGLSKPNSLEASQPMLQTTARGISSGEGLFITNDLAVDPKNLVSNTSDRYNQRDVETNHVALQTRPGLFKLGSFVTTDDSGKVIYKFRVTPSTVYTVQTLLPTVYHCYQTPVAALAYNYAWWRGTMKYRIFFNCSPFQTARVMISWHPTWSEIPVTFSSEIGEVVNRIVEIRGSTEVNFSIPFLSEKPFLEVDDPWTKVNIAGAIAISIVNPITIIDGANLDTAVNFAIYCAADEDMQFWGPVNRENGRHLHLSAGLAVGNPVQQGTQASIREIFLHKFDPLSPAMTSIIEGLSFGESIETVLTLLKRATFCSNVVLTPEVWSTFSWPTQVSGNYTDNPIDYFRQWALFYAGGKNFTITDANSVGTNENDAQGILYVRNKYSTQMCSTTSNSFRQIMDRNGFAVENWHVRPCMEVSQPYYHPDPFYANDICVNEGPEDPQIQVLWFSFLAEEAAVGRNIVVWLSMKDDFSMGWLRGPPIVQVTMDATIAEDKNNTGGNRPKNKPALSLKQKSETEELRDSINHMDE